LVYIHNSANLAVVRDLCEAMSGYNSGKLTERNRTGTHCIPKNKNLNTKFCSFDDSLSDCLGYVMLNGEAMRKYVDASNRSIFEAIRPEFAWRD
jgi:hypothetical protein